MLHFDPQLQQLVGPAGTLAVAATDEVPRKLALLLEGECHGLAPERFTVVARWGRFSG
jgi:hypothetical protein